MGEGLGPREKGSSPRISDTHLSFQVGPVGHVVSCVAGAGWQEMVMLHACKGCHRWWRGEARA